MQTVLDSTDNDYKADADVKTIIYAKMLKFAVGSERDLHWSRG